VQDGTPYGRYRLLEVIGRNEQGETWRAFDTVTQREVAVTVLADDGGDTVAKAIPQPQAGPTLEYPAHAPESGFVVEYPVQWASGSFPTDPTKDEQDAPKPAAPKKSRNRLIALSSAAVVVVVAAVVAGYLLAGQGRHGGAPQASSSSTPPGRPPDSGPFTGKFAVKVTAATLGTGKPDTDGEGKQYTDTWNLRSACSANGCVATATMGNFEVSDMVFDNVGVGWIGVAISHIDCGRPNDEAWNVVSLAPQPDGTMSGEVTRASANGCFTKRTATLTRTGDTDVSKLPDPTHLDPRTVSPAEALHGGYDTQTTYANGHKNDVFKYGVRTDCLRAGDRCMSFFTAPDGSYEGYVYANGTWTLNEEYDSTCSKGGKHHVVFTATMALPDLPQNPIASLVAHGFDKGTPLPGNVCPSQAYDETYTRTGD
jgi:serine/threonine-protein kinase